MTPTENTATGSPGVVVTAATRKPGKGKTAAENGRGVVSASVRKTGKWQKGPGGGNCHGVKLPRSAEESEGVEDDGASSDRIPLGGKSEERGGEHQVAPRREFIPRNMKARRDWRVGWKVGASSREITDGATKDRVAPLGG